MFGLKAAKSWMEAHLGRPRHKSTSHQNQKRAPKDSSTVATGASSSACSNSSSCSASGASSSGNSTSSSSTNTAASSNSNSNGSTTTAIVGVATTTTTTTTLGNNNPPYDNELTSSTVLEHLPHPQERTSNFQTRSPDFSSSVTTSSSVSVTVSSCEPVTALLVSIVEGETLELKNGGGGGAEQKGAAIGTRLAELESHAPGESDLLHHHQPPSNNCNASRPTVTTSVSNSTSILSGSFSNSLTASSPDTGYSTDGYSPKSVYPALSFDSSSSAAPSSLSSSSGNKSTTSTSKSSYAISSLVSSELLHSSKQTSLSSGASCSVQHGLDEYAPSPSSPALTASTPFSQSCSSGISTGTSDSGGSFPKGHHHHENSLRLIQQKQQHSIPEDETEKQQVIMGIDGDVRPKSVQNVCHQLELQQQPLKSLSKSDTTPSTIDPLARFASLCIDLQNQDNAEAILLSKHNGRTHRRAESMDARTPSHEDYKPLVQDGDESGESGSGGNPSLVMTAAQAKNIRTSFVINSSGQIVEFSSYKNAFSICSPRRERTRIKTNPWITVKNSRANNSQTSDNSNGNPPPHANPARSNSTSSDEDCANKVNKMNINTCSCPLPAKVIPRSCGPLEIDISGKVEKRKYADGESSGVGRGNQNSSVGSGHSGIDPSAVRKPNLEINNRDKEGQDHDHHADDPEELEEEEEEQFVEDETGIIDHDSTSSLLYRVSTSASDSGKGTLEPGTNRNSTESSCLLSDSTTASTRNSIISHETEHTGSSGGSRSGRSSSGESISSSHHHHHHHHLHRHHDHHAVDDDTLGHASPTASSDSQALLFTSTEHKKQQPKQQHIHQKSGAAATTVQSCTGIVTKSASSQGESNAAVGESAIEEQHRNRTFKHAAVSTDLTELVSTGAVSGFPKSTSVSVGVGTTSSNKSAKLAPIMVDKETDILSDWANTDDDGDEEIETDRNDNETVTPAPSSPGTDVDRGLFSQSTSSATTDIDFGDSSAATQASSTAVFPPSSLLRQHPRYNNSGYNNNSSNNNKSGNGNRESGARFQNNNDESNVFGNGDVLLVAAAPSGGSQMVPGSYDHHHHYQHQHNINNVSLPTMAAAATCFPSVPIIRPVLAAASQHHGPNGMPDSYAYDIADAATGLLLKDGSELHSYHHHNNTFHPDAAMCFTSGVGGAVPNFNLDDEGDYPEMRESSSSSHHKGIARGALGFLRKIFKKGACSTQRQSPDSVKGKKTRGKSDNNLQSIGLGSPLLTISEPLSNPRYSAVLTTKKQMNPTLNGYFLTPTPNSFRRRSGTGTDSSDSNKGSKSQSTASSKTIKTDIIRLPQGPLSPQLQQQQSLIHHQQQQQQRHTSSSHSSASSCSGLSTNGIPPQTCSTFLPPGSANFHQLSGLHPGATISANKSTNLAASQSNSNTNSTSASSSIHSLMSTSTSAASGGNNGTQCNRPSSQQNQSKTPVPHRGDPKYYANSSPTFSQSPFTSNNNGASSSNNSNIITRGNGHSMSPPPLIPAENCSYLSEVKNQQQHQHSFLPSNAQLQQTPGRRESHSMQACTMKGIPPYESPRLPTSCSANAAVAAATTARMNSPSFNNYSPIHRLVVTGGNHLLNRGNPNCPSSNPAAVNPSSAGLMHYPPNTHGSSTAHPTGESPLPIPRYSNVHHHLSMENGNNNGNVGGNGNNNLPGFATNSQIINRPGSHHPTSSPSPLINHRYSSTTSSPHPYPSTMSSSQHNNGSQNAPGNFFASPSPILRNPRYQYITSSNQNSPVLNASKRMNGAGIPSSHVMQQGINGPPSNPNGPAPLLSTFAPLPSSSSASSQPRESLINNNSFNANTITGSPNLNSSDPFNQRTRQVVSTSLSYNEFENMSRQQQQHLHQQTFLFHNNSGSNSQQPSAALQHPSSSHHHIISQPQQQQLLHQSHKSKIHHQQNHYYSSPIVKGVQQQYPPVNVQQTLWSNSRDGMMMMSGGGNNNDGVRQYKQRMNQNLRFNNFLVRHRQLPQFYHTQWGLQERIYETVDSEDEHSRSDEMSTVGGEYDQDGNEIDRNSELSLPVEVHRRRMRHSYSRDDEIDHNNSRESGGFLFAGESRNVNREMMEEGNMASYTAGNSENNIMMRGGDENEPHQQISRTKSKRSKPKSLSASGKPIPRPVVALPMMPGTFLSETETRLLEADKETDKKYKRLINEAEALLKEITVEKSKRSGGAGSHDNFLRLEDCPQSDPLRRKAYDCWALRRLQQELAGCCASPPVLHRSRLNLQSPSTPTIANNPYLSHFQNMAPPLPQQVPYMTTSGLDGNQNNFEF